MTLTKFLTEVVRELRKNKIRFALAGGLVASIYRETERMTKDLDFLFLAESDSLKSAEKLIKKLGLEPSIIRKANLEGGPMFAIKKKLSKPMMVCGRSATPPTPIGLDFILPEMPWFEQALHRAELRPLDFGIGEKIPALTVEDVVIAKLYSFKNNPQRFQDLDDLQSLFKAQHDLDIVYLAKSMIELELKIPKEIKVTAPQALIRLKIR